MATAIANTESRARADRLADEQATLRRLATLVAHEAPLEAVFAKVAEEVARTVGNVDSALWRDDGDGTVTAVAVRGPSGAPGVSLGTRLSLDGDSVIAAVLREGRPHRVDDYSQLAGSIAERARELGMRSAVGCPIVVGSRTWGAMTVATYEAEPFAAGDREARRPVQRPRGHGDRQRRGARGGGAARPRAGGPAARGDAGRAGHAVGGALPCGVRRGRGSRGGGRLRRDPLRGRRHGDPHGSPQRHPALRGRAPRAGSGLHRRRGPPDRAGRTPRHGRPGGPGHVRGRPGGAGPLRGREPDRRRGRALGRDHDRLTRAPAAGRDGAPARRLHRVGGDRDRQHPSRAAGDGARRRAGGAPAGGDAGGEGGHAHGRVRAGGRGGRRARSPTSSASSSATRATAPRRPSRSAAQAWSAVSRSASRCRFTPPA